MSGFTPGPWEAPTAPYQRIDGDGVNFSGGDWEVVPPLGESGPVAITNCEANARLIAAAPEMYELLCLWQDQGGRNDERAFDRGQAADQTDALLSRIDGEPGG